MKKWLYRLLIATISCLTIWGMSDTVFAEEGAGTVQNEQLTVSTFLTQDQTTAMLTLEGGNDAVSAVYFSIWHDGLSDLKSYGANKLLDGRWLSMFSINDYGKNGNYYVQATITYSNGQQKNTALGSFYVENNGASTMYVQNVDASNGTFDVIVAGINAASGVRKVDIPVWSTPNQSDIAWYSAQAQRDGTYVAHINIRNHQYHYGTYHADAYITSNNGISSYGRFCEVTIKQTQSKVSSCKASEEDVIWVTENVPYGASVRYVKYGVWNKGLSDLRWYTAVKQNDGRWLGFMSCRNFGYGGTFWADAYAVLDNGQEIFLGRNSVVVPEYKVDGIAVTNVNSTNGTYDVVIGGVSALDGVKRVRVAAWTASDLSDLHYYDTMAVNDSTYILQVDVSNHAFHYGGYGLSVYVTNGYGSVGNVKSQCTNINAPNTKLSAQPINDDADCVIRLQNPISQKHIQKTEFYVWNQGVTDMRLYTIVGSSQNTYHAIISMTDFNKMGVFYVQAKLYMDTGTVQDMGLTSFRIEKVNGLYSIMGTSGSTVQQMISYYKANAVFPSYYNETSGIGLEAFCQMYYEECVAEGVRVEVAFGQAMKETGFLRFSGRVPISAYNFAGMGAIDSDANAYATFASVREGIRAQVQHLKAYASTEPLKNACVDPRFNLVSRGTAIYTEWLGIHENPYGKGWATATNYGYSLKNDYITKLFSY